MLTRIALKLAKTLTKEFRVANTKIHIKMYKQTLYVDNHVIFIVNSQGIVG